MPAASGRGKESSWVDGSVSPTLLAERKLLTIWLLFSSPVLTRHVIYSSSHTRRHSMNSGSNRRNQERVRFAKSCEATGGMRSMGYMEQRLLWSSRKSEKRFATLQLRPTPVTTCNSYAVCRLPIPSTRITALATRQSDTILCVRAPSTNSHFEAEVALEVIEGAIEGAGDARVLLSVSEMQRSSSSMRVKIPRRLLSSWRKRESERERGRERE